MTPPVSSAIPPAVPMAAIRARTGVLTVFAVNGFAFASWTSRVPDIKQMLDLTPGNLGIMLLAMSVSSVLGLPIAGHVAGRLGSVRTLRISAVIYSTGLFLAALAVQLGHSMYLVMPGLFLFGLASGVWDVTQNLQGAAVERAVHRAIMPWFHAAFSGGTVTAALIGAGMVALHVPVVVHLTCVAVLALVGGFWGTSLFFTEAQAASASGQPSSTTAAKRFRSAWTEPRTLLIGVMALAAGFTEGAANDWMALAFVEGHGLSNALGVVGLAVFLVFMTTGRILGTNLLDRYGRTGILALLFGMATVGSLMVILGSPVLAFIGAAMWGLGASLGFPVGMSAAADDPARAPMRISVVSTIAYTSFLAGPPFLGFLGDHVGVLHALLAVSLLSAVAILVAPAAKPLEIAEQARAD